MIDNVSIVQGKLTKIDLKVKNSSPVSVKGKSHIEIYKDDKLHLVVESNETQIFEEETLISYVDLKRGNYKIDALVFYNQKKSSIYIHEFFIGREVTLTGFVVNTVGAGNLFFIGVLLFVLLIGLLIRNRKKIFAKKHINMVRRSYNSCLIYLKLRRSGKKSGKLKKSLK